MSSFFTFLRNFNLMLREKVMTILPSSPVWNVIQEFAKRPTSSDHISANILQKSLKFRPEVQCDFVTNGVFFFASNDNSNGVITSIMGT